MPIRWRQEGVCVWYLVLLSETKGQSDGSATMMYDWKHPDSALQHTLFWV